ncbi:fungal-specific transcription factor [Talaromyces proteolyticus]|uniref:Fungal-specific transcription factor n=1 Tax=Talaromyces proteolyticus TaxID=1131652 RepID=A0AAD4L0X3_9EURO|nr:fungal-specific transcription factor [Talaromyces proteolyticus]KAH8705543.1 fungal-specific transcription factor [Talaromyces proteolyticus]
MRHAIACVQCRRRKKKCYVPQRSNSCCKYCAEKKLCCSLTNSIERLLNSGRNTGPAPGLENHDQSLSPRDTSPVIHDSALLPDLTLQLELARLYFDYIHDQFHTIFHKPSLMNAIEHGTVAPVLIYGIIALSARFSDNVKFKNIPSKHRGLQYAQKCSELLNLRDISLTTVQAALLLGAFWTGEGDPASESVYICVGIHISQLLRLPIRAASTLLEREVDVRVWSTLRMIDVWSSNGMSLPRRLGNEHNELPINELTFLQLTPHDINLGDVSGVFSSSLVAEMVKLNKILAAINELNKNSVEGRTEGQMSEKEVDWLAQQLTDWERDLPDHLRDNAENLSRYASLGLGRVFVAVYCGYYHFGQLLYYRFLQPDSYASCTPNIRAYYALQCKAHAAALCQIIYMSHSTPGCDVLYSMIGHVLVIASTVQIHTLLFSNSDQEIKLSRSRLERNFEILLRLYEIWPCISACLLRLRVFHTACRKSMTTSFVLDRWMLRFLREFGQPVDERKGGEMESDADIPLSLEKIGLSPAPKA